MLSEMCSAAEEETESCDPGMVIGDPLPSRQGTRQDVDSRATKTIRGDGKREERAAVDCASVHCMCRSRKNGVERNELTALDLLNYAQWEGWQGRS